MVMNKFYLGIDPGRSKTGLALVDDKGKIIALHIAESQNINNEIFEFTKENCPLRHKISSSKNDKNRISRRIQR